MQSGKVHLPPTPTSRSSSLKRVKNLAPYAKRSSPHALDPTLLYGTTTATGQYRSPSRILFESGYLTLGRHRHHNHHHEERNPNHIYENLYNSPSSPSHKSGDQVDSGQPPAQSQSASDLISTKMYQSNLRDSVQLKSTSCPDCMTSREGTCSRHRPPDIPPNHPRHHHHSHHRNHSQHQIRVTPDDDSAKTDSLSSGCSTVQSNLYGKTQPQSNGVKSTDQLNHHIVTIQKEHKGSSPSTLSSSHKGKGLRSNGQVKKTSSAKKHKKRKKQKEWFFESDPQRRFQFLQSTLIIVNVIGIVAGLTGLIAAGFVDPVYKLHTFGGQMCLASVYTLAASLIGLYGARRESCTLLMIYGIMILVTLFARSVLYFIAALVTPASGAWIALSMLTALLEALLILFAFGLAAEVSIKKRNQAAIAAAAADAEAAAASPPSATTADSEISKSSTGSPSPIANA